jgi:hypothetical protein
MKRNKAIGVWFEDKIKETYKILVSIDCDFTNNWLKK